MSAARVALAVVFNHRFERNIPRLEKYYGPRFSNRRYLMPFADGSRPDVIRVVENGCNFSGHIAQGYSTYNDPDITHYAFLGDDLILNPSLNESNLANALNLPPDTAYTKNLTPLDNIRFHWEHSISSLKALRSPQFDYQSELPPAADARKKFEAMGLQFLPPWPRTKKDLRFTFGTLPLRARDDFFGHLTEMGQSPAYPLLSGYSDFIVVPTAHIRTFAHYCGVFAALNLFAEVAVPTALALACPAVRTELAMGEHFRGIMPKRSAESRWHGTEIWKEDIPPFCARYGLSWDKLLAEFPSDVLYFHPVKLSQWKEQTAGA